MLQNKLSFNQSSVELQIAGLPDYSNNDNKEDISIISKWKLSIINQPEIEGGVEHLKSVIRAFYKCAALTLLDRDEKIESDLIDLKLDNEGYYNILLKSTKPNIKPLIIKIGYAEFSDIINCFDQLKNSTKIKINLDDLLPDLKKSNPFTSGKNKIIDNLIPPLIALFSISFLMLINIYFYEGKDNKDKNISLLSSEFISKNSKNVIKIK
tara:strand:- start:110 stop:739 length:630 start_codon:yes stop_codon:yes gene_type:complete